MARKYFSFIAAGFGLALVMCLPGACNSGNGSDPDAGVDADGGSSTDRDADNRHTSKRLLWDDYHIESKTNVAHELGVVQKHPDNPVLVGELDWEGIAIFGLNVSVFYDEHAGLFKMWYEAAHTSDGTVDGCETGPASAAYAESTDGVHWVRPLVGLTYSDIQGADCASPPPESPTNVVFQSEHGPTAFIDEKLQHDHPERYKNAFASLIDENTGIGYSADGIHWNAYNNGQAVVGRAADTTNQLLWDPLTNQYLLVNREDLAGDTSEGEVRGTTVYQRVGDNDLMSRPTAWETRSVIAFTREGLNADGTPIEGSYRQIHATKVFVYEDMYIALTAAMEGDLFSEVHDPKPDVETRHDDHVQNCYALFSRDAVEWNYDWAYLGEAEGSILPRGPASSWDKDQIHSAHLVTANDRLYLYYFGSPERFGVWEEDAPTGIGLATLRLDGFIALAADDTPGTVVTKPFDLQGTAIEVNVNAQNGAFDTEILDESGEPIAGFTKEDSDDFHGDDLHHLLAFNGSSDLSELQGRTIKLRFHLLNTRLYAFAVLSGS